MNKQILVITGVVLVGLIVLRTMSALDFIGVLGLLAAAFFVYSALAGPPKGGNKAEKPE